MRGHGQGLLNRKVQSRIGRIRTRVGYKGLKAKLKQEFEVVGLRVSEQSGECVTKEVQQRFVCVDGSEAVAHIAYSVNELFVIYPITPSTAMSEFVDVWNSQGRENVFGSIPDVIEMQSEAGVAGALHGALTTSSLATTFTSSQGLLLMIPNFYKIAGEMLSTVVHVATRSLACSGLSMYCDHADVMACRQTGFVMIVSNNPQEAQDIALIATRATFRGTLPIMHFFDGFRTSHEIQKIVFIEQECITAFLDKEAISRFRMRALDPEKPTLRGTAQNPDIYFSGREAVNKVYDEFGGVIEEAFALFEKQMGRSYKAFEYYGDSEADSVIVLMGSAVDTVKETVIYLNQLGEKYGVVGVRLYRPFRADWFVKVLPKAVKKIVVLDRTKEPGSQAEPLCLDVIGAIQQMRCEKQFDKDPVVFGGRYGLGSFEFTPAMVKGIFDALDNGALRHNFTVGIDDDVMHTSIRYDSGFFLPSHDIYQAIFYGLGSDGTVSANKNTLKMIGKKDFNIQGYFSYEAKKAGAMTISYLRIGHGSVNKPYLIERANFVACHKFSFLLTHDILGNIWDGGVFLLASLYSVEDVWDKLPCDVQHKIIAKNLRFYVVNAHSIARRAGLSGKINIVMQVAAFKINEFLSEREFCEEISQAIRTSYAHKGEEVIQKNLDLLQMSLSLVHEVCYPKIVSSKIEMRDFSFPNAPKFVQEVTGVLLSGRTLLPVSKIPPTGVWPVGTSQYEKRDVAEMIPEWDEAVCINCGMCAMVCPHAAIRIKAYDPKDAQDAPSTLKSKTITRGPLAGTMFTVQVSPEDCTGCGACVNVCPVKPKKALGFVDKKSIEKAESENFAYFKSISGYENVDKIPEISVLATQLKTPLLEFSGACSGCGETPYIKLLTQMYGDHLLIANASGCSSVFGGYMPTVSYTTRSDGTGPAWSNSLFEDNAEFGLGMRKSVDRIMEHAKNLLKKMSSTLRLPGFVNSIIENPQKSCNDIEKQRDYVKLLKEFLSKLSGDAVQGLLSIADFLVKKSVWAIGGDGWAYDIGYGGLDHVLATGENIKILVLDTEIYSNTGGQASKATPLGALAKFASCGKALMKKPLAILQSLYGYIYVAQINMGANMSQTIRAFKEAEEYPGPAIVVAYSHCVSHGIDMMKGLDYGKRAVTCGIWPLFRYNPLLKKEGKNPLVLDSLAPKLEDLEDYLYTQSRFKVIREQNPKLANQFLKDLKNDIMEQYEQLKLRIF